MPASQDMSYKELTNYRGTNPCPTDFNIFWNNSLSELENINPDVNLNPSDFSTPIANCFDMTFTSIDNSRIHAKVLHPKNPSQPHPAIIMFHGLGWYSGDWFSKLPYISLGFSVIAMDCRGQGFNSQDSGGSYQDSLLGHLVRGVDKGPSALLYQKMYLDTVMLSKIVMSMNEINADRIGVTGMSQGGALALVCAALNPCIAKVAPVFPYLCDFKRGWEMGIPNECFTDIHNYFRKYDPLHEKEEEFFNTLGYIDVQNFCSKIKCPVLAGCGLMDTTCPPSTQYAAYNKITSQKTILVYPEYRHEELIGHNDKIFSFMSSL